MQELNQPLRRKQWLVTSLLILLLLFCGLSAWFGVGIQTVQAHSVRNDSVNGIHVTSGGPGDGK